MRASTNLNAIEQGGIGAARADLHAAQVYGQGHAMGPKDVATKTFVTIQGTRNSARAETIIIDNYV